MIEVKKIHRKQILIGRIAEQAELRRIGLLNESAILVVYGRRRVGKTELIESVYADRNIKRYDVFSGHFAYRRNR